MVKTGIRTWSARAVAIACSGALSVGLVGCASTPTQQEINDEFHYALEQAKKVRDLALADCNGNAECEQAVSDWYQAVLREIEAARRAATEERWREAYERRKETEKKLREMIPTWPELKDLIDPFLPTAPVSMLISGEPKTDDGCDVVASLAVLKAEGEAGSLVYASATAKPTAAQATGTAATATATTSGTALSTTLVASDLREVIGPIEPCEGIVYYAAPGGDVYARSSDAREFVFGGNFAIATDSGNVTGGLDLSLDLIEMTGSDGTYTAEISGGSGSLDLSTASVALTVVEDTTNVIEIEADGNGWMTVLVEMEHSMIEWAAVLPVYKRIQLPVKKSGDDLTIELVDVPSDAYVPYYPHPASDFDGDGELDLSLDASAFATAFLAQSHRADIDANGVWDSDDVNTWVANFNEDLANGG